MLVLSRKVGETIQIADNITVTVADVRGGRVRLSIDAPKWVRIVRQEILDDSASAAVAPEITDREANPSNGSSTGKSTGKSIEHIGQ